eukprot:5741215-Pleurochrysis_carterae.AAC.1
MEWAFVRMFWKTCGSGPLRSLWPRFTEEPEVETCAGMLILGGRGLGSGRVRGAQKTEEGHENRSFT